MLLVYRKSTKRGVFILKEEERSIIDLEPVCQPWSDFEYFSMVESSNKNNFEPYYLVVANDTLRIDVNIDRTSKYELDILLQKCELMRHLSLFVNEVRKTYVKTMPLQSIVYEIKYRQAKEFLEKLDSENINTKYLFVFEEANLKQTSYEEVATSIVSKYEKAASILNLSESLRMNWIAQIRSLTMLHELVRLEDRMLSSLSKLELR